MWRAWMRKPQLSLRRIAKNNTKGCVKVMEKLPQHILLCYVILILIISYLLEKKDRTYNSIIDPEIFTLEIELFAPVV